MIVAGSGLVGSWPIDRPWQTAVAANFSQAAGESPAQQEGWVMLRQFWHRHTVLVALILGVAGCGLGVLTGWSIAP